MQFSRFIALAASVATAAAQAKGFNYGSTNPDGSGRNQGDYTNLFNTAKNLVGASGFTSARLYTMIDAGSANSPISAIPAAINTQTSLLLGLWASAGQANFNNELAALSSAISTYGTAFTDLVVGISVGSEDLYRDSVQGMANNAGIGAGPDVITSYISQVRTLIGSTILNGKPVGHVDTWNDYVNGSNAAVITACDFLGMDAYPYFETTQTNSIDNGKNLFYSAYDATVAVAQGKPVWVTETGWPVSGPQMNLATANVANSKTYWDQVGCSLFGTVNTWWYTIYDGTPSPSFGIVGSTLSTTPLFDLTCPAAGASSSAAGTTLATSVVQTAPTQAVTAPATATQVTTGVSAPVSSLATAPGVEGGAGLSQTQANSAPATTVVPSAVGATSGAPAPAPVSQISDGQVQAPVGAQTTTGAVVSQISDGQVQAPTSAMVPASAPVQSGAATATGGAAPSSTASASGKSCPAALTGTWEYPHLIVPVDKDQPSKAYGTQYFGTINSHVSTIFNFDIPASYAGKTCSLVFLFPTKDQLETSDFTYSGEGGIDVYELSSPATEQTTYSNAPSGMKVGSLPSVKPGNSYTVTSHECGAGQRVSFEFEATGSFALNYFQDYNPSPIGSFISVC